MASSLAFIGAGGIGKHHIESARDRQIPISWIIDVREEMARPMAESCHARFSTNVNHVWNDSATAGVVISVPNALHKSMAIQAMRHGKDVLLEKPMAMTVAECREIHQAARETGRLLQIGFVQRYTAAARLAKEIVAAGELGEIYHVKAHLFRRRGIPGLGRWFTTRSAAGGGVVIDLGVHLLDLSLHILDHPTPISVMGQVHGIFGHRLRDYVFDSMWAGPPDYDGVCDVEDTGHACIRFPGGVTLDLHVAWAGNFPSQSLPSSLMGFFGNRGGLTFQLDGDHLLLAREEHGHLVDARFGLPETAPYAAQITDFYQSLLSRRVGGATGDQGIVIQALVEAIYASSHTGATIPFCLESSLS